MFVICSVFRVEAESAEDIDTLYRNREHLVDNFEGFIGVEVLRNDQDPAEFTLLARWADREAYENYRRSREFVIAHRRMMELPRNVKLSPGSHSIKYLNYVAN